MQIRVSQANRDHKEEWEVRDVCSDQTVPTRVRDMVDVPLISHYPGEDWSRLFVLHCGASPSSLEPVFSYCNECLLSCGYHDHLLKKPLLRGRGEGPHVKCPCGLGKVV